jgi:hypothetical protein
LHPLLEIEAIDKKRVSNLFKINFLKRLVHLKRYSIFAPAFRNRGSEFRKSFKLV